MSTQGTLALGVVGAVDGEPVQLETPVPEKPERPDHFSLMAVKKFGAPEGWQWRKLEALGDIETIRNEKNRARQFSQMKGYVHNGARYRSGKSAGKLRKNSPVPGTERTIVFSMADFDAFLREWELETGQCHKCDGTGAYVVGVSVADGERTQKCPRCFGTGKAHPAAVTP